MKKYGRVAKSLKEGKCLSKQTLDVRRVHDMFLINRAQGPY